MNDRMNDVPVVYLDEKNNVVIVGEFAFRRASYVDTERAIPDEWRELELK